MFRPNDKGLPKDKYDLIYCVNIFVDLIEFEWFSSLMLFLF